MKTTLFFLFLCVFSLFAENVYPQRVLPSLNMKDITLKEVFSVIEKESDYLFLVTDEISAELKTKVTLTSGNKMISEVMDQLLRDTGLTYIITGRQVAVYRNTEEQKAAVTQQEKRQITGTVLDAQTKEPVIGANVWIKESTVGAITNADGKYTIPVTGNTGILVFSFIGYQQQEAPIGNNRTIDVLLEESRETSLDEVVVVAYGRQKKESVIGAISTIDVARLKTPTSKISNILAGQLAGVIGFNRSGEPGEGSTFYIRGISTFGSTKTPLVLVDGIERSLDLVDPEDIESFSILKDATATAVYGVRGANGVLLVTTRKGVEGKPRITVRAEAGIVGPTRMPKAVNSAQLAELYNEAYGYDNNGAKRYSDEVIRKFKDGSDPDLYPNTDWIGSLYNDWATNQRANVNISGGGTLARYYVAGSIYNEGSIYKEDKKATGYNSSVNFNKVNFRANLDLNLTPSTVLNINLANVYEKKNSPGRSTSDIWSYSFHTAPYAFPLKYSDGKLAGPTAGTGYNPYNILIYSGYKEEWWNNAQALVGITQDFSDIITPGLKASVKFSWDALSSNSITRGFTPQQYRAYSRDEATGELEYQETNKGQESLGFEKGNSGNRVTYLEASVTYDRLFNEIHRVGALFLYNQKEKNNIAPGNNLESLPYRNQGVAGRMTYSYRDKYFAEFNIGYNGSENFSPGRRFGVFPAGAIGWLISNEDFWEPYSDVVDVLKLRASYGIVGNDQIGGSRRFIYEATMKTTDVPSYEFNNSPAIPNSAIQVGEVANPYVGWEEAAKTNIGLELALYRNLRIQADYFYEKREGIFLQRASMPDYVGITTQPWVNVGKMKNQGFDGSLEFDRKVGEVMLTSRANFTYTHNTILNNDQPDYLDPYR
ncbi:MAG: TonB-dependent receptor, partial [Mediterranea sp.]|nr:TonB-dependent receptor [Mediterranea sp.]